MLFFNPSNLIEWHFQLSQLNGTSTLLYRFGEDSASCSMPSLRLRGAYTDAHLFETICQIRGDELDGAGTNELVHHILGEAKPDEHDLGSFHPMQTSRNVNHPRNGQLPNSFILPFHYTWHTRCVSRFDSFKRLTSQGRLKTQAGEWFHPTQIPFPEFSSWRRGGSN
jgi:hypothetical protein